ncbi:hypothetical protein ASC75_05070 [Aminobacter sp. DSM 101952]|uniref:hypothetical protein n=1 Tax=Aminobacter sp. DSM 101952 TaxID=2735891 RepID=UPI0006FA7EF6|nr:hypothetical protein [Aminobacter sp. DSM 101952]KQU73033.1 hypothetical protein ASC75_05070 [Aminobacter sp. DSM 101952]
MARSQVREVSGPSAIQGVATPVNTYVRPADPAPSSLHQLAEGLAAFDSGLGALLGKRKEKADENAKQRAIRDAYSGASAGFDEGVKRGLIPPQESPTYMEWYKKTQGDMQGRKIADEFTLAHQQWEGRNGGDPEAFKGFVQDFLKIRVGDITDPQVLAGLNPHIESIYQNGYSVFTQERGEAVKKGALATAGSVTMDTIDRAEQDGKAAGGIDYEGLWGSINAQRDEVLKRHTEAETDAMFVDSILLQAEESGNEELLDLLDRKWGGKDHAISSDPEVRTKVMASRYRIMSAQASKATYIRDQEERQEKVQHNTIVAEELRKMASDPNYQIPEETLKVLGRRDPEFRTKLAGYRKQMADKSFPEDNAALLHVFAEIDRDGSKEFVHGMVAKGVIRDPNTLIRALDRVEQVQKANAQGGIFDSPTYKDVVKRITNATGEGDRGYEGVRGITEHGVRALYEYRSGLLKWVASNPDLASRMGEREKFALEFGQHVLSRVEQNVDLGLEQEQSRPHNPTNYSSDLERQTVQALAQQYGITEQQARTLLLEEYAVEEQAPPATESQSDGDSETIGINLPGSGPGPMAAFWEWLTRDDEQGR